MREQKARLEADRRSSREAKRRRTGVCEDCGGVTRYGGGKEHPVALRCPSCAQKRVQARKRGTGPLQVRVLAFLGDGERRYTEILNGCGISKNRGVALMQSLLEIGLVERPRRGVYRRSSPDA